MSTDASAGLFGEVITFPNCNARDRLNLLVGLDKHKDVLAKNLELLVAPKTLTDWQRKHHPDARSSIEYFLKRPPLIILAGDVGTGKTELAETIPDRVARNCDIRVRLYPLTLSARGSGQVGEMTQLIDSAFAKIRQEANKLKLGKDDVSHRGAVILLIDEADALAQSREESQMHHEDRAGVNALIRGVDSLSHDSLPVAVIMNTNRTDALDPAIKRRATNILEFNRPNEAERIEVLTKLLEPFGLDGTDIKKCSAMLGESQNRLYGATYSDLTQRFLPNLILSAFPSGPVTAELAIKAAQDLVPTRPFGES